LKIVGKQAFKKQKQKIDEGKFENSSKNKHLRNKTWIRYRYEDLKYQNTTSK
jgi:hypothetical protein